MKNCNRLNSINELKISEMKKGTYVSRAVFAKLQAENHRLLNDIRAMVENDDGTGGSVWSKWRKHFKNRNDINNMLREIAKVELPKLKAKLDSNPQAFK